MKIHWPKTLADGKRKEAYCGDRKWQSLSSTAENVDCGACVAKMVMELGYVPAH